MVGLFNEVLGREVEVPELPQRIVSFSPAATETLFLLGAGDRVVGVSAFCARPPQARTKRRVGSYSTVRHELLDELSPDLILTVTGYQREFAVGLSQKYQVYPLELPVSVAGIVDLVVKIGLVAGAPEAGREVSAMLLRKLGKVRRVRPLRTYVELDLGGPVTFGAHSYITDAIRLFGCSSIYERERAEWLKPDLDEVRAMDPDAIFYEPKMFAGFGDRDLQDLLSRRGWGSLRSVRKGYTFLTPRPLDFLAHHGPSFITEAIPWLQGRLGTAGGGAR
jgi:ABC-type Fe3+-hydroxamate transport system substrate-binding protein